MSMTGARNEGFAAAHASSPSDTAVGAILRSMGLENDHRWAEDNYETLIRTLVRTLGLKHICEIGGGRNPMFTPEQVRDMGVRLTVNDISARELELAPSEFSKACFDISAPLPKEILEGDKFDLMFSRMVFEHVKDARRAWKNVYDVLNPGGVGLAYLPTLYALPYVVNMLIPEFASRAIVKMLYPHRADDGSSPKFPAYYDYSYSIDGKVRPMLETIGFREIDIVPFWGHDYFVSIPGVREVDHALSRLARARNWRALTAYTYIIVRK